MVLAKTHATINRWMMFSSIIELNDFKHILSTFSTFWPENLLEKLKSCFGLVCILYHHVIISLSCWQLLYNRREEEETKAALALKMRSIKEKARRLKEDCAKSLMEAEKKSQRYRNSSTPSNARDKSYMFSYFSYVPPTSRKKPASGKRTQRKRKK